MKYEYLWGNDTGVVDADDIHEAVSEIRSLIYPGWWELTPVGDSQWSLRIWKTEHVSTSVLIRETAAP